MRRAYILSALHADVDGTDFLPVEIADCLGISRRELGKTFFVSLLNTCSEIP